MKFHTPTVPELEVARTAFEKNEPRDLFYRAATELVALALRKKTRLKLVEALAVLLKTWNASYYRFRTFDAHHFAKIEGLLRTNSACLQTFRRRSIHSASREDERIIGELFKEFEDVLGPVGASKCLHLLAPRFLPLWDRKIAKKYGLPMRKVGQNSQHYCRFFQIAKGQCDALRCRPIPQDNVLKAIDEYNYCKANGWI